MRKLKNEELNRIDQDSFQTAPKMPVTIVLDNIRSMHNVGATFRTSDAFRVERIVLTGITAQPPHRDIHKAALGATETVTWSYEKDPDQAVKALKEQGYTILAIEQSEESTFLDQFAPDVNQKYALIFGNEVFGVDDQVMELVDGCLEIPQFGTKHSINISVSVGLVIWDFYCKLKPFG